MSFLSLPGPLLVLSLHCTKPNGLPGVYISGAFVRPGFRYDLNLRSLHIDPTFGPVRA